MNFPYSAILSALLLDVPHLLKKINIFLNFFHFNRSLKKTATQRLRRASTKVKRKKQWYIFFNNKWSLFNKWIFFFFSRNCFDGAPYLEITMLCYICSMCASYDVFLQGSNSPTCLLADIAQIISSLTYISPTFVYDIVPNSFIGDN